MVDSIQLLDNSVAAESVVVAVAVRAVPIADSWIIQQAPDKELRQKIAPSRHDETMKQSPKPN